MKKNAMVFINKDEETLNVYIHGTKAGLALMGNALIEASKGRQALIVLASPIFHTEYELRVSMIDDSFRSVISL